MSTALGSRIRARREELKLSQAELAKAVGVKYQSVQQWESGATFPKRGRVRARLAAALGWSESDLEFGPPPPSHQELSAEAHAIGEVFDLLTPAQRAYYTEAIYRDVTLGKLARSLPGVGGNGPEGAASIRRSDSELARAAIMAARRGALGKD